MTLRARGRCLLSFLILGIEPYFLGQGGLYVTVVLSPL
jgi:hypothetical protein